MCGGVFGYRFIKHEQAQNARINELQAQISILSSKLNYRGHEEEFTSAVSNDGYDYLAIGNSITTHEICDYWWGEWGMAASSESFDYYHRFIDQLKKDYGSINSSAYNFKIWELQSHDRSETYEFLDKWLVPDVDLITIQLSENCFDISTFEVDLLSLINHIKEKCSSARIVVIDDFWNDEKSKIKKNVCQTNDIYFVDLSDIRGDQNFQVGMGSIVLDSNGEEHIIEHSGVSIHPGNEGMQVISERLIECIKQN